MPLTPGQQDKAIKMGLEREPRADELNNQEWANNPGLLIDTLWGNGGSAIYAASQKPLLVNGDMDNLFKDLGITPTQADYDAAATLSPKDLIYYFESEVKKRYAPSDAQDKINQIKAILG